MKKQANTHNTAAKNLSFGEFSPEQAEILKALPVAEREKIISGNYLVNHKKGELKQDNNRRNFHTPAEIDYPQVGGRRSPEVPPGRPEEVLQPESILIRDFTDAVKTGDWPSFYAKHPEQADMGWRHKEAERSRVRREQASDKERAAARTSNAASKRRRRSLMSEQEHADVNAKKAARMREKRHAEKMRTLNI